MAERFVVRRNVGQVVAEKAPPGRGGDLGPPRHQAPNRGLADLDAELEQFPVDRARPTTGWLCSRSGSARLMARTTSMFGQKRRCDFTPLQA